MISPPVWHVVVAYVLPSTYQLIVSVSACVMHGKIKNDNTKNRFTCTPLYWSGWLFKNARFDSTPYIFFHYLIVTRGIHPSPHNAVPQLISFRMKLEKPPKDSGGWRLKTIQVEIACLFNIFATLQPTRLEFFSSKRKRFGRYLIRVLSPINRTPVDVIILANAGCEKQAENKKYRN